MDDSFHIPGHRMVERVGSEDHPNPKERGRSVFCCECGWQCVEPEPSGAFAFPLTKMAAYNHAMGHLAGIVLAVRPADKEAP